MEFTYSAYESLIDSLRENDYAVVSYHDWGKEPRCVILRHDIDYDIKKSVVMAELERKKGVKSTYFTLISSDFYNPFSADNTRLLKKIVACGHEIGLHFDEVKYKGATADEIKELIVEEAVVLEKATGVPVRTMSMHRPSKAILDANLQIPGIVNSYDHTYFEEFKYLSDSRRRWREPVEDIINEGGFSRLHILTHAFWYNEEEKDISGSIREFVNSANEDRYHTMADNITDIEKIMSDQEVLHE